MINSTSNGQRRIVVENISPAVDLGQFPVKRCVGDILTVEADCYIDGHEQLRAELHYRRQGEKVWREEEMTALGNDRWRANFSLSELGVYEYTVMAWLDEFLTWLHDFERRVEIADITSALLIGAEIVGKVARRAPRQVASALLARQAEVNNPSLDLMHRRQLMLDADLRRQIAPWADRSHAVFYKPMLHVVVDVIRARFSAWYEMFPRSAGKERLHGTFEDCIARLPYVAELGFDVLYLPPIHPIGLSRRKGPNNTISADATDPGSPWAIGNAQGGHKEIHPQLGTLEDFHRLLTAARLLDIEVALDLAFQCSPDHPYVRDHPQWFHHRPDGSIQFAENPPKKYEDIFSLDFDSKEWLAIWLELKSIFEFWIRQGVRIFRVDNPHTKPFAMWERIIKEIKQARPDILFLAEAFTRPKIMHRLAKIGFSQSYTYFPWRNTRAELTQYFEELTQGSAREYFRPNAWPNTPDILTEYLQTGGRAAFIVRLVLAATLSANYGIYGPPFELQKNAPLRKGSEEYLDSEKYQIQRWDIDRTDSLRGLIRRINLARREHPALQNDTTLHMAGSDNAQIICYAKVIPDHTDALVIAVNLDPFNCQSAWVDLPLGPLGLAANETYRVHDILNNAVYEWRGARNYVALDPSGVPAHILHVRRAIHA